MYVFDAHSDIFSDIAQKRERGEKNVFSRYHLPYLKKSGVGGTILVLWVEPAYADDPHRRFENIKKYALEEIKEMKDSVVIVKDYEDLLKAEKNGQFYMILGVEGLSGIGSNANYIYDLYDIGVRHIGLTWNEKNDLATGIGSKEAARGLTQEGKKAVAIMDKLGILIDVSHLNEKSFWDVCEYSTGIIIASHSNARRICGANRNLSDNQLMAIAAKRGVIGINSWSDFVKEKDAKIENVVEHIDYITDMIGIDHVGFGFDFCNYFESDPTSLDPDKPIDFTKGMEGAEQIPALLELLYKRGYSSNDIEKIAYGNFKRALSEVLGFRYQCSGRDSA